MKTLNRRPMSTLLLALLTFGISMITVVGQLDAQQQQSVCNCNEQMCPTQYPAPPIGGACAEVLNGCNCNTHGEQHWQIATGRYRHCLRTGGGCCPDNDPCWQNCAYTCYINDYYGMGCINATIDYPCGRCAPR